ncbi:sulfurase [Mycolicibacterium anyangense]|uniref:nitric oxide dioxygenase n=1 Tax=Mycolicibacterium anyangense TaxID=1431246 RepID=A0A6N4W348_9MYCO|nr:MOSC and FAD-binding oxidoreductase domain-containing protein [Mycolicibacterium anyangense]BBZ76366.1 sulfurase [Mycolicibacterium anyangense]
MAHLVAVNVGLPRDVAWNDHTVHTGAWKSTVQGPRMVRRLNVDGDGQGDLAGHGGEQRAVLVYQVDSYRHWAQFLGRDDLTYGHFGENFTVDGLPDDDVCIGDRYRIGEAVFEVTQPRVTCYRVGLRLGEPRMAALLVAHRRPGFYLRVITEADVEAGQEIIKVGSGPERVSVAELDALLYLPGHSRATLNRALRIPALSPGWQTSLRAMAEESDGSATGNVGLTGTSAPAPAWSGFRSLTITEVHQESRDVRSVTLGAGDGARLPGWRAGQSITVRLRPDGQSTPVVRTYSLSNSPGSDRYRISVKREPYGVASGFIATAVGVGDEVETAAPRGTFVLRDGAGPVVLVSAGVGATPVLSMLHQIAAQQPERPVWWVHGSRDGAQHPFAAETRELLNRLPGAHRHTAYSRPGPEDRPAVDFDVAGRLSATMLDQLGLPSDADAYVCGPADFMTAMRRALVDCGLEPSRIRSETFGAGAALNPGVVVRPEVAVPHQPAGVPGTGPLVSFARSGITARWGEDYPSMLDFAEACEVPTRWACRTGVCHTCETPLLAGAVRYDPEPLDSPAAGTALICCAQPTQDVVLDL